MLSIEVTQHLLSLVLTDFKPKYSAKWIIVTKCWHGIDGKWTALKNGEVWYVTHNVGGLLRGMLE